jgi:protein-S-isoprenylcysteine O-methyltransferase Ste14
MHTADFIALALIMFWPVVPIWWIPVHKAKQLVRRFGLSAYLVVLVLWLPVAFLIYVCRNFIFTFRMNVPAAISVAGICLFLFGGFVQLWVVKVLTIRGITGRTEIWDETHGEPITRGPFAVVRHPTYLSHTFMFFGAFLWTGIIAAALVAIADIATILAIIVPLEEKELLVRFGESYKSYMGKVPGFIPGPRRRTSYGGS